MQNGVRALLGSAPRLWRRDAKIIGRNEAHSGASYSLLSAGVPRQRQVGWFTSVMSVPALRPSLEVQGLVVFFLVLSPQQEFPDFLVSGCVDRKM